MEERLSAKPLPLNKLMSLSLGGKKRNKETLVQLNDLGLNLSPPELIISALGLRPEDLNFLEALALRPDGWQPLALSPSETFSAEGLERLARKGLVLIKWPGLRIALSDAGRLFLVLLHAEPLPQLAAMEMENSRDSAAKHCLR